MKRTHLFEYHSKHGRLVEFAGFEHALWYEGIISEHLAVRERVGLFDVTHMGRCLVEGRDAAEFLDRVLPRRTSAMEVKRGRYSTMLNERGGIKDDLTVFRLSRERFLLVYNAANREKDFQWLVKNKGGFDVEVRDVSDEVVMLAVQGPRAIDTLQSISRDDLSSIKRYWCDWARLNEFKVLLSRTGYTGEDGFEVYLWDTPLSMADRALRLWNLILKAGKRYGIKPCGLGARDSLRLEAGMCLYGSDMDEETTPFEARLDFTVEMDKDEFIGKKALERQLEEGVKRFRVGFKLIDKGIPRRGQRVYFKGRQVGMVTSGTYSPILKRGIGMGYVDSTCFEFGLRVEVDVRGRRCLAELVDFPFYDVSEYGWRRRTA